MFLMFLNSVALFVFQLIMQLFLHAQTLHTLHVSGHETVRDLKVSRSALAAMPSLISDLCSSVCRLES